MDISSLLPIIGVILALLVVGAIFIAIKPKKSGWKNKAFANLSELENRMNSGDALHKKSAVVDADKLLDFVMKSRGIKGETMGDRLKNAQKYFDRDQYNRIWEAHKLRNRLVHEIDSNFGDNQIRTAFYDLKSAIRKLAS
jgi:hypothetical protein